MHGRHLKKRGQRWHYYRNRPKRFADIEPRAVITFSLRTDCLSDAKLKAAQISKDLDEQWREAQLRGKILANRASTERFATA
ncbi:MAG: DUF6538 domain-containing protein, partial [Pseudomonadota bacterium]